jgi:DNA-binding Lrp family transcriptional regulator
MENYSIIMKLDEKDYKILDLLKQNSNLTTNQISKKTRIPITTVHNRIKKLKQEGIIKNFTVNLDYEKLGKPLTSYILVTINQNKQSKKLSQSAIGKKIKSLPDIHAVDIITGDNDMLLKIRSESMKSLNDLITHKLRNIEGVEKSKTIMVLEEI